MNDTTTAPDEPRRRRRPRHVIESEYVGRDELLQMVPLARTTIDSLERRGLFPKRFVLRPTHRVAWKRSEVMKFLDDNAKRRGAERPRNPKLAR